ncbi:hypothetical protein, partial [Hymenobacter sp. UYP22]|uniref:hypothetical protein n=1 Tax=Hymenobacter sp. UYP22 TaxID=3156348 RepID=UPI00339664D8
SSHSKDRVIYAAALDTIFRAVSGRRTLQKYGSLRAEKEVSDEEADALAAEMKLDAVYEWYQDLADWVDKDTGEVLTHYQPDAALRRLVETGIR